MPRGSLLDLRGQTNQQILTTIGRNKLDAKRKPRFVYVQGKRDRWLSGDVPDLSRLVIGASRAATTSY